jgi:hypothetical protein
VGERLLEKILNDDQEGAVWRSYNDVQ